MGRKTAESFDGFCNQKDFSSITGYGYQTVRNYCTYGLIKSEKVRGVSFIPIGFLDFVMSNKELSLRSCCNLFWNKS